MNKVIQTNGNQYNCLIEQIGDLLLQGRRQAASVVNNILVQTYWQVRVKAKNVSFRGQRSVKKIEA
jgi:hypothetical protein